MRSLILPHVHITLVLLAFCVSGDSPAPTPPRLQPPGSGVGEEGGQEEEGGMELTPWWPLVMATGERVTMDCGVYQRKAGSSGDPELDWFDWSGTQLCEKKNDPRIGCTLRTKNHVSDTHTGAYKVLSLSLGNLSLSDTGSYSCRSSRTINGTLAVNFMNLSLTVLPSDTICTFEGTDMCGWRNLVSDNNTTLQWRHHDAAEKSSINRAKGLRYDHTYGASKHHGHLLDIDIVRDKPVPSATARLQSPILPSHTNTKCFHFWYIYYGKDNEYLRVLKHKARQSAGRDATEEDSDDQKGEDGEVLLHLNDSVIDNVWQGEWVLATLDLPAQTDPYHLILEAHTCKTRCKSGSIAIDDVRFFNSACDNVTYTWPDRRLQVRLLGGKEKYEGRVEILHDGMWGSVCSTQFGDKEARVICNTLGYRSVGAVGKRRSVFGQASSDVIIWLQKLGCGGNEEDLGSCIAKNETWGGTETCSHDEDASVICGDANILPTVMDQTPRPHEITTHLSTTRSHTVTTVPPLVTSDELSTSTLPTTTTTSHAPSTMTSSTTSSTEESSGGGAGKTAVTGEPFTETTPGVSTDNYTASDTGWSDTPVKTKHQKRNTGAAVGISLTVLLLTAAAGVWVYRRRKNQRKSKYIVFSNPKYSREHLPANDISLDSPLTSGSSILA